MRASIIANPLKDEGYKEAARAASVLMDAGVGVFVPQDVLPAMPPGIKTASMEELYTCDFIITLGGDGTILAAARGAAGRAPILGVNMGRKGFLTEVELPDMENALRLAASGDYIIKNRMMLAASVFDGDGNKQGTTSLALNDIYVSGTTSPRLVHVEARVDENVAGKYSADGVLVSSPTGSTGYALSAGGPVVSPEMQCLIVTPVCAHTLSAVPLVIPANEVVTLRPLDPTREVRLNADGDERMRIPLGWRVEVSRAEKDALFLRFGNRDFYGLLREKLTEWND